MIQYVPKKERIVSIPQQKFREIVFQLLYSHDIGQPDKAAMTSMLMKELSVTKKTMELAHQRMDEVLAVRNEIDKLISNTSKSYDFQRIHVVERNILRLGTFEIYYDELIPPKVAIAEAMRLARKFGTAEAANFVNAILDALYKLQKGESVDDSQVGKAYGDMINSEKIASQAMKDIPKESPDAE